MLNPKILKTSSYNVLLLSGVVWGFTPLIYKNALLYIGIISLMTIRFLAGAAFLYLKHNKKFRTLKKGYKHLVILFGFFTAMSLFFYIFGLERTTALHASVISMTLPFWLYLVISIVLKEKIHSKVIFGSLTATIGLLVIILSSNSFTQDSASITGDLMMLLAQLLTALSITTAKIIIKNNKKIPAEQMVFYEYFIAGIITLAVLVFYSGGFNYSLSLTSIGWLIIVISFAGIVPILMYYKAIKKLPGERIGDGTFVSPVVGVLAATIFLDEAITITFIIGSLIIFFGLMYSNNKIKPIHRGHYIVNLETSLLCRIKKFEKEVVKDAKEFEKKVVSAAKSNL